MGTIFAPRSTLHAPRFLLAQADARLIPLASNSVHCVAMSPPYLGLRDYQAKGQIGAELRADCLAWARCAPPCNVCYVCALRSTFAELWRVLHPSGTVWLNLGDSYNGSGGAGGDYSPSGLRAGQPRYPGRLLSSYKQQELMGIPWSVAKALQADGWLLRAEIIWHKPNAMPESSRTRPSRDHETIFLLAKQPAYFYDRFAIMTPAATPGQHRHRRTVWSVPTSSYKGAHFATWPPRLVEPMIKASTSERGACPICGAQWVRLTQKTGGTGASWHNHQDDSITGQSKSQALKTPCTWQHIGWRPGCKHDAQPVPALVLDPFAGSGTTLLVAQQLGRRAIGLDISLDYLQHQAAPRLASIVKNIANTSNISRPESTR